MNIGFSKATWCAVATILVVACSGSTEEGGSAGTGSGGGAGAVSSGPIAQDQFAQAYTDAICNNAAPCCQKYGMPFNGAKCSAAFRAEFDKDFGKIAATPGVSYDAAKAGECIAWVEKITKLCAVTEADAVAMQSACGAVWRGSKGEGEACSSNYECSGADTGAAECDSTIVNGEYQGTCAKSAGAPERGVKGSACNATCMSQGTGSECSGGGGAGGSTGTPGTAECWIDDGLQCEYPSFKCVELVPEGQPCSFSNLCVASAWCKDGTCVAKSPAGGDCDLSSMGWECVDGTYCDKTMLKCNAKAAEGASCTDSEQCATGRCEEGKCIPRNAFVDDDICSE